MRKLTLKIAREYVRRLGGRVKKNEYDEYVVRFGQAEYFAGDLDDAIATAACMAGSHAAFPEAEAFLAEALGGQPARA